MKKQKQEIVEIEIDKVIGLDEEEKDDSVGYYQPFCIIGESEGKRIQIYLNWERLIDLAKLLKPYLESHEAEIKMDEEMYEEYKRENKK